MQIKKTIITIVLTIVVCVSILFSGYFWGKSSANRKWTDDYNRISLELEGERERAGQAISELKEISRLNELRINELESDNTELRDYAEQLRADNTRLRNIQSATEEIYFGLGDILQSDMELTDKIISVAREIQKAIDNMEEHSN